MFPITKIFMGNGIGHGDVVEFSNNHNGVIIDSPNKEAIGKKIRLYTPLADSAGWKDYSGEIKLKWFGNTDNGNSGTIIEPLKKSTRGDGGSTSYYKLPDNANVLGDLIHHKGMNHSIGEAFCALYRLEDNGERKRNLRKVKYYIEQELSRC